MGQGLSSDHRRSRASRHQPPAQAPARVIGADGSLREFSPSTTSSPSVSVSDVLGGNAGRFFVCSSDALYFDADVPALGSDELLRPGQIYFVLPAAMLARPLSSADMAAMAVRASDALALRASRPRRGLGMKKVRVVPARAASGYDDDGGEVNEKLNQRTLGGFETAPSTSPAKNAKKSATVARPAMKRVLSTIEEATEGSNGGVNSHRREG